MDPNRKLESTATATARITTERRLTLDRLAALERASGLREPGSLIGDNTPSPESMEEVQELIARDREQRARDVLLRRLRALGRAEERIREGTYGVCEQCMSRIPGARLEAVPEAVRCVRCAELAERRRPNVWSRAA